MVMTNQQFKEYFTELNLPTLGISRLREIREGNPARQIKPNRFNGVGQLASRKMGMTIQWESRTVEYQTAMRLEHAPEVIEYYDQPYTFSYRGFNKNGRRMTKPYTPDFVSVEKNKVVVWECKLSKEVRELSKSHPEEWKVNEDGSFSAPLKQAAMEEFGFEFRIITELDLNKVVTMNLRILTNYISDPIDVPEDMQNKILEFVDPKYGTVIRELLQHDSSIKPDHIHQMLANEQLFASMTHCPLTQQFAARLYLDSESPRLFQVKVNEIEHSLRKSIAMNGGVLDRLAYASQDNVLEALEKENYLNKQPSKYDNEKVWPAKRSRWNKKYRAAEAEFGLGSGWVGLLNLDHLKGNRKPKLIKLKAYELMDKYFKIHNRPNQQRLYVSYAEYRNECQREGFAELDIPSDKTFADYVKGRKDLKAMVARYGFKAANQIRPPVDNPDTEGLLTGNFPFEFVHIDSTTVDAELEGLFYPVPVGKANATFAVDDFSGMPLGHYTSFDPISVASVMMVMRDIVKRWGKLPQNVVLDGGSENVAKQIKAALALIGVNMIWRRTSIPQEGSTVERKIHTLNTQLAHVLDGNTQSVKEPRSCSPELLPKNNSVWNLPALDMKIDEFLYHFHPKQINTGKGMSPKELLLLGLELFGEHVVPTQKYDEEFIFRTRPMVKTKQGKRIVQIYGVENENIKYKNNDLFLNNLTGKNVEVMEEPDDIGFVFTKIKHRWEPAKSLYFEMYRGFSEEEIAYLSRERRHMLRDNGAKNKNTDRLGAFVHGVKELQKELSKRKVELLTTTPWRQESYAALEVEDYSMNPSEPEFEPQLLTGSVL